MQILLRKEADTLPISNLWGSPFAEESTVASNLLEEHSKINGILHKQKDQLCCS